jgi:thiosulfate/3-mercaptopyruvate sulfurtransferase
MSYTTLVSTAQLAAHLEDPRWIVFDCRHDLARPECGRAEYERSHILGARFMHLDEDLSGPLTGRNGRHPLPDPDEFAAKLGRAGASAESQIVAYDAHGGIYAARLWWLARWLGHDAVAVLDGGYDKWLREERPESSALPQPKQTRFERRPGMASVDVGFIARSLHDPAVKVVDARSPDRYRGENETLDPVGGHIPGAINRFFRENLDSSNAFKSPAELRAAWERVLGGLPPHAVVHSCGSGVTACHNLLAMEVAGLTGSRLYSGSWSEWCADPARPVATGAAP